MIYNFHNHFCWIRGGVEMGMAYRAKVFRRLGLNAKFIFTTTFPGGNVWDETSRMGFLNSEVLWMYSFFSNCRPSQVTYTLEQLVKTFEEEYIFSRKGVTATYQFPDKNMYYVVTLMGENSDLVFSVSMISNACLVRQDYYTYCRIYSDYYIPVNGQAELYLRRFFHEDGSVAYEEIVDGEMKLYKFSDRLLYSREELLEYMMSCLHITKDDVILIDGVGAKGIEQASFLQNVMSARVGLIIHSNHFETSNEEHVLWNSELGYFFAHPEKIDFYVTNTKTQANQLSQQLFLYKKADARVEAIPAAYLEKLRIPERNRNSHALITAGRLYWDKRTSWIVEAVVEARRTIADLTLDIFGEGYEENDLKKLIHRNNCGSYVRLCGFQKLDEIYQNYDAYVTASCGETLGITLLEALGSGLPIVGFDLPYGVQELVDEGENGYKITDISVEGLANGIIRLFLEADMDAFREHSYKKAENYLTEKIEKKWERLLC